MKYMHVQNKMIANVQYKYGGSEIIQYLDYSILLTKYGQAIKLQCP